MPEEMKKGEAWYQWSIDNWDTKWNASEVESDDDGYCLNYNFSTAWSPPIKVVEAIIKQFPKLNFTLRYFEGGMEFNGYLRGEKGVVKEHKQGEYFGNRGG
jgi:hypothetical protein